MKHLNFDLDQLKRQKYSSPASKMDWLFDALCFGKTKKTPTLIHKNNPTISPRLNRY